MLKFLRKHFDASASQHSADAENQEEVNMTEKTNVQTDAVGGTEALASLNEQLETATTQLTEAKAQIEELTTQLAQFEEAKIAAEEAAKEAKFKARSDKAVEALGTEKAEKLLAATQALDDASFEAILAVSGSSMQAESQAALFTETGVEGNADKAALTDGSLMQSLQAKYLKPSNTK